MTNEISGKLHFGQIDWLDCWWIVWQGCWNLENVFTCTWQLGNSTDNELTFS